jgi:soluble cytochrome b562
MAPTRTDKYWLRIKLALLTPFVGIILVIIAFGTLPAGVEGSEINFNTFPLLNTIFWGWLLSSIMAVLFLVHSIYRDKQELSKDFSDINQRHWITIGLFIYFTGGVYQLWYLYARYKRTKTDSIDGGSISDISFSDIPLMKSATTRQLSSTNNQGAPTHSKESSPPSSTGSSATSDVVHSTDTGSLSDIKEKLDRADLLRENAREERNNSDYDSAYGSYYEAKTAYQSALQTAKKSDVGLIDIENIEQKLTAVKKEKREFHRQHLEDMVESLRSKFDRANALVDDGELKKAKDSLQSLESSVKSAKESAVQHDFTDLQNEIETLEEWRKQRLAEISQRIKTNPVPDKIPRASAVSVEYDALIERESIGSGGNADVTRAVLAASTEDVTLAIKEPRMAGTLHAETVERMLEEAQTWDKLDDHDHIVGLVDYGSEPIPWIAMEYMDAGHLGERSGELEVPQALWTAIAVTKGVRHAHRRGVAHLDLKPENVLFRSVEEAWDVPKVADWGLSKHLLNHSKSIDGLSPQYAAPEQFDEDFGSADDITDIYQLGALFYELFTGQPPFGGKPAKAMHKVLHEQPVAPSEIASVPDELDEILLTALAKQKDDRYDNVAYLRDALQDLYSNG